jgi:hypothetical protein
MLSSATAPSQCPREKIGYYGTAIKILSLEVFKVYHQNSNPCIAFFHFVEMRGIQSVLQELYSEPSEPIQTERQYIPYDTMEAVCMPRTNTRRII